MAKIMDLDLDDEEMLCRVGKALSSPVRIKIIKLLNDEGLIIGDIAKRLDIPASSAAMHVKVLEQAEMIVMEEQPGTRGSMKLCNRKKDVVHVNLTSSPADALEAASAEMPVGFYAECKPVATCGIADQNGIIGTEDIPSMFYLPARTGAGLLWSSGGYVEYRFPNLIPEGRKGRMLSISVEMCSEAPGYKEDWQSDITLWINEKDCGYWRSPSDFGARRGRLTPDSWPMGSTQYGKMVNWEINQDGCYLYNKKISDTTVDDLDLSSNVYIAVRIGNKSDARYVGGFNIFGKGFGDYDQDIVMTVEYE